LQHQEQFLGIQQINPKETDINSSQRKNKSAHKKESRQDIYFRFISHHQRICLSLHHRKREEFLP